MKLLRQWLVWNAFLLLSGILSVVLSSPLARGQEVIDVTTQTAPVDLLTINDIDFVNATTPKWLFTIDMRTRSGGTVTATMKIRLQVALAGGDNFGGQDVVTVTSNPFAISGTRTVTNLDLRDPLFRRDYHVDAAAKHRIEETALPSGMMPAGTYNFVVEVTPVAGGPVASGTFAFVLSNPSSMELLFPVDGDPNISPLPLFQWIFDGTRATIAIFEKLPGQTTLEEAASGTPQLTATVATNTFQYPPSGARALVPGRTYVWYVEGHVRTAGGTETLLRSPLRSFSVQTGGSLSDEMMVLDNLERTLDPKYKPLFDQIRSEGLAPDGVFRVNGAPLTRAELMRIISGLQGNPGAVMSAELSN